MDEEAEVAEAASGYSLTASALLVAAGGILGRLTGLLRIAAIAYAIGIAESRLADTYHLANSVPNIVFDLLVGGFLTSVLVPVLVDEFRRDEERGKAFVGDIFGLVLIVATVSILVGWMVAPWISDFYTSRLGPAEARAQSRVLIPMIRLFLPQIVLLGFASVATCVLNARRVFGPSSFLPALSNVAVAALFLLIGTHIRDATLAGISQTQLISVGLVTTGGVALMSIGHVPFLRSHGVMRISLPRSLSMFRKVAGSSFFGAGFVFVTVAGFIGIQWVANKEPGSFAAYQTAVAFTMVPFGLLVASTLTAILPRLSELASAEDWREVGAQTRRLVRMSLALLLPASMLLVVAGPDLLSLFLERGNVERASVELVAVLLVWLAAALPAFAVFHALTRVFYAAREPVTPFVVMLAVMSLNVVGGWLLLPSMGVRALGVSHFLAFSVGTAAMARLVTRRVAPSAMSGAPLFLLRCLIASLGAACLSWTVVRFGRFVEASFLRLAILSVAALVCLISYVALARLLRVAEVSELGRLVKGTVTKRGPAAGPQVAVGEES